MTILSTLDKETLEKMEDATPSEDLMQEHGLLERIILVMEREAELLGKNRNPDLAVIGRAADLIRAFVQDFHEQNEERYVFAAIKKNHQFQRLAEVLVDQHVKGR